MPRYPNIEVKLTDSDGNAFMLLGKMDMALTNANIPQAQIEEFMRDATSGDYHHLLRVCRRWVTVT